MGLGLGWGISNTLDLSASEQQSKLTKHGTLDRTQGWQRAVAILGFWDYLKKSTGAAEEEEEASKFV
jgi:hypothetical protein